MIFDVRKVNYIIPIILLQFSKSLSSVITIKKNFRNLFKGVLQKCCSEKYCKFYKEILVPESLFNKVSILQIKNTLPHVFPLNFAKIFRTYLVQNISGRLTLNWYYLKSPFKKNNKQTNRGVP